MKKHIISALAAICSLCAVAEDEEVMVIRLTDGSTAAYPVETVESVTFGTRRIARDFSITEKDWEEARLYPTLHAMWRVNPAEIGQPTTFAFATGNAGSPDDAPAASEYGVILSISPSKLYSAEPVDLASETGSYTLCLIRYADGAVDSRAETVTEGTLTTALDRKNRHVTILLDATFDDGTVITMDYDGVPADVDNVDGLTPAPVYGNEAFLCNADGNLLSHADIANVKITAKPYNSMGASTEFAFTYAENNYINSENTGKITIVDTLIDNIDNAPAVINLAEGAGVELRFGAMQLWSITESDPSFKYKNIADNGTLTISRDADGTYHLLLDVTNTYISYMGPEPQQAGSHEHLILNFDGTPE
ncbi:MAG: hypothetical protein K2H33_06495 [Muribaculaceae bacterium]|nr:hypothetical protein [Muribaculaceae bacterium]MDE6118845.1 hypothetical protein [Muribaculaceae bacterium]MDE6315180.1 hypothetical protein [Muribaculaceae bacterium]